VVRRGEIVHDPFLTRAAKKPLQSRAGERAVSRLFNDLAETGHYTRILQSSSIFSVIGTQREICHAAWVMRVVCLIGMLLALGKVSAELWSVQIMQVETKFLRLCQPAAWGEEIGTDACAPLFVETGSPEMFSFNKR
jgi:hypothetical protein